MVLSFSHSACMCAMKILNCIRICCPLTRYAYENIDNLCTLIFISCILHHFFDLFLSLVIFLLVSLVPLVFASVETTVFLSKCLLLLAIANHLWSELDECEFCRMTLISHWTWLEPSQMQRHGVCIGSFVRLVQMLAGLKIDSNV